MSYKSTAIKKIYVIMYEQVRFYMRVKDQFPLCSLRVHVRFFTVTIVGFVILKFVSIFIWNLVTISRLNLIVQIIGTSWKRHHSRKKSHCSIPKLFVYIFFVPPLRVILNIYTNVFFLAVDARYRKSLF